MDIKVRENIDLSRLRPEAIHAWNVAMIIACDLTVDVELTSGHRERGQGEDYSKHHDGLAIDFITNTALAMRVFLMKLIAALPGYDVIYHCDRDGAGKHFHVEWDRKV